MITTRQNGKEWIRSAEFHICVFGHLCTRINVEPNRKGLKSKKMNIETFIRNWIATSNAFDRDKYLSFYLPDAVLEDASLRRKFEGHKGIQHYFDRYFIGFNTHTEQVRLIVINQQNTHLEVLFTGDFPEGTIRGAFEFKFDNDKIALVKADLIH